MGRNKKPGAREFHGESVPGRRTKEYSAWCHMRQRCSMPQHAEYPRYGARGIRVCPEWDRSYLAFLAHIGRAPSPAHTIDRIDNDRGYEPHNVRWVTVRENLANRRISCHVAVGGERMLLMDACRKFGVPYGTARHRLFRMKMPIEQVLRTDVRHLGRPPEDPVMAVIWSHCKRNGVMYGRLVQKIRRGASLRSAIKQARADFVRIVSRKGAA